MPYQTGRIGPWPGGVNLRDADLAPEQMPATQLQFLLNLDVESSGVLRPRLGCRFAGSTAMYAIISGGAGGPAFSLLGTFDSSAASLALVSVYTGTTANTSSFFYSSKPDSTVTGDWTAMPGGTLTGRFSTTVQYQGFLYLVPDAAAGGVAASGRRRADPTTGAWSAVAAIPQGDTGTMLRERMFVVDQAANRVYYSKATDPTTWAAPDGGSFDVNPGDGQRIQAVAVVNSQLYIFKRSRTYLFTFTADPALDGQLTLISDQLGADDATTWENGIICVNQSGVYRLLNNYFSRMDELAPAGPFGNNLATLRPQVVLENDNLIVRTRLVSGFTHLAMNLRTNAWSVRSYADANVVPASRWLSVSNPTGGTVAQQWNLYGHGATVLRTTALGPLALARTISTLDTTQAGGIVSPRYSMLTSVMDGSAPMMGKGMRGLTALLRNQLVAGDAAITCQVRAGIETGDAPTVLDLDLSTTRQSANVPSGQWGGRIPLVQYRFLSTAWQLDKAQTTVSPGITVPATVHDLSIRGLVATIDVRGGSERV
jgi:hypothetical protein